MAALLQEYDTTLDTKHRITVRSRNNAYRNYHVRIYGDGHIVMEPRVLVHPKFISKKTLRMMDKAINNLAQGKRSKSINTEEMRSLADALPD